MLPQTNLFWLIAAIATPLLAAPAQPITGADGVPRINLPWDMVHGEVVVRLKNNTPDAVDLKGIHTPVGFFAQILPVQVPADRVFAMRLFYAKPEGYTMSGAGSLLTATLDLVVQRGPHGPLEVVSIPVEIAREIPLQFEGPTLLAWDEAGPQGTKAIFFNVKPGTVLVQGVAPTTETAAAARHFECLLKSVDDTHFQIRVTPRPGAPAGGFAVFRVLTDHPDLTLPGVMVTERPTALKPAQ